MRPRYRRPRNHVTLARVIKALGGDPRDARELVPLSAEEVCRAIGGDPNTDLHYEPEEETA